MNSCSAAPGAVPGSLTTDDDDSDRWELADALAEDMPELFAVVQTYRDSGDHRVAAWVLEFADRAEAISADGGLRMSVRSAERVLAAYRRRPGIRARLVPVSLACGVSEPPSATPEP